MYKQANAYEGEKFLFITLILVDNNQKTSWLELVPISLDLIFLSIKAH